MNSGYKNQVAAVDKRHVGAALYGLSYILRRTAPSLCLGDVQNIETDVSLTNLEDDSWESALYLYDTIEGGVVDGRIDVLLGDPGVDDHRGLPGELHQSRADHHRDCSGPGKERLNQGGFSGPGVTNDSDVSNLLCFIVGGRWCHGDLRISLLSMSPSQEGVD